MQLDLTKSKSKFNTPLWCVAECAARFSGRKVDKFRSPIGARYASWAAAFAAAQRCLYRYN